MAPEKVYDICEIGLSSDIWSLGIVFFELLHSEFSKSPEEFYRLNPLQTLIFNNNPENITQLKQQDFTLITKQLQALKDPNWAGQAFTVNESETTPELNQLITGMLHPNPLKRPGIDQVLQGLLQIQKKLNEKD
jgi:serine/threonine protein kinase